MRDNKAAGRGGGARARAHPFLPPRKRLASHEKCVRFDEFFPLFTRILLSRLPRGDFTLQLQLHATHEGIIFSRRGYRAQYPSPSLPPTLRKVNSERTPTDLARPGSEREVNGTSLGSLVSSLLRLPVARPVN